MRTVLFTLFILISIIGKSQSNYDIKARYIYQFTKMINWPIETRTGMFRIGVLGSFDAYKEISDVTMGRNVGNQNIEVMNIYSIQQLPITNYHMLLVGDDYCTIEQLKKIEETLKSDATLIITSKINYSTNLACIGFEGQGKSFQYNYSEECIKMKKLVCSKEFLSLGVSK